MNIMEKTIFWLIGIGVFILLLLLRKTRPTKNSHKIPQIVEIKEFDNPENNPNLVFLQKGFNLILSREKSNSGYNLFVTIKTNGKDLTKLKKIIFSWSEWEKRIFNFNYFTTDNIVKIENNQIRIDLGSFNNCNASKNFLKRTVASTTLTVDLLDFIPSYNDFEWEKEEETKSVFIPIRTLKELKNFKKGRHYIDS